ncbi:MULTISPECIES: hypothetical protein [Cyanophyceae]|nr:hypothetical protein [Trichocoleus sp. FACHB-6]
MEISYIHDVEQLRAIAQISKLSVMAIALPACLRTWIKYKICAL